MTAPVAPDSENKPHIHLPDGSCCAPKKFAHLHQHTQYSLLDGAAKLKDLLKWAKEVTPEGQTPALAMTDHGNMHGAVHFYNYAQEAQVKPILGYEAYVVPGFGTRRDKSRNHDGEKGIFHLTLLARDFEGYQNLCRLSSRGYTEGYYYKPRIDHELLTEHSKGVIAFSGCLGSEVQQLLMQGKHDEAKERLLWYRDLFGENYYIEIQNHGLKEQDANNPILRAWAQELGIGMVATNDGHYVKKADATAHETLLAIQTKATLADENRFKFPCDEFYVKNLEEMHAALPPSEWGEELFDNTAAIADLCNVELPVGKKRVYQMPALPIPEGRTMAEELRVQTYAGAVKRYPAHLTEGLLRDYAGRSLAALEAGERERVLGRLPGLPPLPTSPTSGEELKDLDLDTLLTLLAFMGSEWERRGKEAGDKYTAYPALTAMESEAEAGSVPPYALQDFRRAHGKATGVDTSDTEIDLDPDKDVDGQTPRAFYTHALVLLRRAEYELSVINNMGFPDYFLIVADYINWAKDKGISVGPGRGCLSPETPIRMEGGHTKPIASVQRGERVMTRDGSAREVLDTYEYDCNEELLRLNVYNGDRLGVTLTSDHEVLAEKMRRVPEYDTWAESTKRARASIEEPTGELTWLRARELSPGDWLFVPTPQVDIQPPANLDLGALADPAVGLELSEDGQYLHEYTLNKLAGTRRLRAQLPRLLPFDTQFAYFLGHFAGDGWLRSQQTGRNRDSSFGLAFHADDHAGLSRAETYLASLGIKASRARHQRTKLVQLEVRSRVLRGVLRGLFDGYQFTAQTKHVPAAILQAPLDIVEAFVEGLIDSDGHLGQNKTRITTTSHLMAEQVRFLLLRLGIPASLGREYRTDTRPGYAGKRHSFTVDFAPTERFGGRSAGNAWTYRKVEGGLLLKLRSIETALGSGKVYDLKVDTNHNYLTSSFVVHNSGAGSLVAYAMRITNLDPLEFELLFERFLNPDRISMPDFDIDFNDARRGEVIDYVQQKYGEDKVAQIATFGTMASKAVLKDVARVMSLEYAKVDKVSKLIPIKFGKSYSLEKARDAVPDIQQFLAEDSELLRAYEFAQQLEGLTRHASVHAAGVVIGRDKLTDLVPVMRDTSGNGMVCQYDMKAVEDIGLIKMDFLGLRTLSFLDEARRIMRESKGIDIDFDTIPFDDEKTFELLSRGDTKGVFQLEGAGIADASRRLKPRRLADIIALSALYRPGPMENIPTYVRRHHGLEAVDYVRDGFSASAQWLEPILKETYGIPVYQEQIMQIASDVAGYSLGGADLLRRAMGKKDNAEMQRQRAMFVEGAGKQGVSAEEANKLFDLLDAFANYGFNKSHSAAYGVITYQTAWLKANYPVEFMAALLTVERRDSDKVAEYASDARKMGVEVLPPDVNRSGADFVVQGEQIYFGLYAIKGLGENAVQRILEERERSGRFKSLADFCSRIDTKTCNRKGLESLIKSGAFDAFGERKQLLESLEEAQAWAAGAASMLSSGMDSLFGMEETAPEPKLKGGIEPLGELEKLSLEKDALGLYISGHPLEQHEGLREAATVRIAHLEEWFTAEIAGKSGQNGRGPRIKAVLAGMIESVVKKPTKSGGMMARFNLADESATIELVAFSRAYDRIHEKLVNDTPALVIVEIESEEGGMRVIAEEVVQVEQLQDVPKVMYVDIDLEQASPDALSEFQSVLDEFAGSMPTFLRMEAGGQYLVYQLEKGLGSVDAMRELNKTFAWSNSYLAYDQATILSRFGPKPPAWMNRQQGSGGGMRA